MLLGYNGLLSPALRDIGLAWHSIVGFHGIVWVGVWGAVGLVFLFAHDAFASLDQDLEEAAESVGARRGRAHLDIALPLALPGLLTAAYLVLTGVLADFGTPRIIGGPVSVLPVLLYHEFLSEGSVNPGMASAGSLISVGLATAVLLLQRLVLAGRSYVMSGTRRVAQRSLPRWATLMVTLATLVFFLLVFVPHLVIAFSSFLSWRADIPGLPFTLDNYRTLALRSSAPVFVSYALSAVSTLVAVVAGTLLAYVAVRRSYRVLSPSLQALTMIPYLIPGTVLAIGLIVVFNREPMRLTGTWMILALAYFIRKVPYATKSAEASLYQVHENLEEAALSVGATPAQALRDSHRPPDPARSGLRRDAHLSDDAHRTVVDPHAAHGCGALGRGSTRETTPRNTPSGGREPSRSIAGPSRGGGKHDGSGQTAQMLEKGRAGFPDLCALCRRPALIAGAVWR